MINFKVDPKRFEILKENVRTMNAINFLNLIKQHIYIEWFTVYQGFEKFRC